MVYCSKQSFMAEKLVTKTKEDLDAEIHKFSVDELKKEFRNLNRPSDV